MPKILVVNGPNMNLLGRREPDRYGSLTLAELDSTLRRWGDERGVGVETFQSNIEGEIVDRIQAADAEFDAVVINPAAYTHYSVAIRDALAGVGIPAVEVHMTQILDREEFRARSMTAPACAGLICGFGARSYVLGLEAALTLIRTEPGS